MSVAAVVAQLAALNWLPIAERTPALAATAMQRPALPLFPAPSAAWNVLSPLPVASPKSILDMSLTAVAPVPYVLTMTPSPELARNALLRTVTDEPATMRMPLPPVFSYETRPVTMLRGMFAPGVC